MIKEITAYQVQDGSIFETLEEAELYEYNQAICKNKNLSKKEQLTYDFILQGYKNQEIADNLDVQLVTIKKHIGSIFKKLYVSNRNQLISKHYLEKHDLK